MADLSNLFAPQQFQTIPQNVNPFELHAPKAAEFKRRIALREAMQAGVNPNNQREFISFMGQRLAQLDDGEGATMMAQQLQLLDQQEIENQRANRRLSQLDTGLDIQAENALTNRMNAARPANKALKEVYNPETGRNEWVIAEDAVGMESARKESAKTINNVNVTNVPESFEPTKTTVNRIQDAVVKTGNQLLRLERISSNLNTDFLTVQGKLGDIMRRGKDAFGASSEEDKEKIRSASRQRQAASDSLNQMIRDMSGVAVSVQEAKRLKENEPNAGAKNKPWDGDSPTDFVSKLNQKKEMLEDVIARYNYILRNMDVFGLSTIEEIQEALVNGSTGVAIEDMKGIYKKRINELQAQGFGVDQIRLQMEEEFGVPFDD